MEKENELIQPPATDFEIVSTRIFNAPGEFVFKAWADPTLLAKWWGPKGFTNTFHAFDFKAGGTWDFTMHAPDGTNYHNKSVFIEIIEPKLIIFEHLKPIHKFRVTASFEDLGTKTRLVFRMLHDTVEECNNVKQFAADANEQNFDRLETVLSAMTNTK